MSLSEHNFNVVLQDANAVKFYSVKSCQNGKIITIGNFVNDTDGVPQPFTPELPVVDLEIQNAS